MEQVQRSTSRSIPGPGVRVPVFDGVRGVAILSVLVFHTVGLWGASSVVDRGVALVRSAGWLGVDLFFVLSGFLITGILLETKGTDGSFRTFYGRRALRILPLYYAVVVVATLAIPAVSRLLSLQGSIGDYAQDLWSNQAWLWTYTHNFLQASRPHQLPGLGHMWSLAIEEQFYLVWPLVVLGITRRRLVIFSLGAVAAIFLLRFVLVGLAVEPWAIRHWTFTRADTLLLGGLGAVVVRDERVAARIRPLLPYVLCGGALFVAASCVVVGGFATETPFIVTLIFPASALTFAALMIQLCDVSRYPLLDRLLEARWLRRLGYYSYAMYVFHWPITQAMKVFWRRIGVTEVLNSSGTTVFMSGLQFVSVGSLTFCAAVVSWRLWESQWLKLKKHFSYRAIERPLPA